MGAPRTARLEGLFDVNFLDAEERLVLAGEYVLGTLTAADNAALEQEMLRNRDLAIEVARWRDRMVAVMPLPATVEPSADLWASIERGISKQTQKPPGGIWNSLSFLRAATLTATFASLVLVLVLLITPPSDDVRYVAVLQSTHQGATWLVTVDADRVHLRPLAPVSVAAGKSLQFWTKPPGAAGPTSLGLVQPNQPLAVPATKLPGIGPDQLFEVTLEPMAGSPTGKPTGPILAVGKAVPI